MLTTVFTQSKYKSVGLSLLVLLLALLPRITTLGHTFIVNDETLYWDWSNAFAQALVNFDWHGTLIGKGYPAITVMWVHTLGAGIEFIIDSLLGYPMANFWQRAALDRPLVFDMLGQKRLVMGITNALLIWLIFLRARKLLGDAIAFLGASLIAFAPFLLADARTMRGDALLSSLMLLSGLDFLLFLRDKKYHRLLLSGFMMGLALLTKMTALPLAGFIGLALGADLLRQSHLTWPARLRWGFISLLIWGGMTTLTVFLLWPVLWVSPLEVLTFMQQYAAESIDGRLNFFWGGLTYDEPLPLFYPNAFLFRANPIVVLGVAVVTILGMVTSWRWLRRSVVSLDDLWQMPSTTRWTILALGLYALIYGLVLNAGALKRDRYLMPIFPATMFIAAAGLLWLVKWAARRWPGYALPRFLAHGRWAWGILLLLISLELGHVLDTHPYYYTYWSPLMGGGSVAMKVMMAEGGIDSVALVNLNERPTVEAETVALLTNRDYAPAFKGEAVRLTSQGHWVTADHIVVRQYHYQTQKMEPYFLDYLYRRPPEDVVEFQGYIWAWTYPGPSAQYYAGSLLDGQAHLLGYDLSSNSASPEQPLDLTLFWQNKGYQPTSEQFFVRLVDAGGFIWSETESWPRPDFEAAAGELEAIVESEARLTIPPGTPPGLYFLKMGLANREENVDIGQFRLPSEGSRIALEKAIEPPTISVDRPIQQPLSHNLTLIGAEIEPKHILTPQTPQPLSLYWQVDKAVTEDYVVSIALLDEAGTERASWLGQPAHGVYPTTSWQPGEVIRDPWLLNLKMEETTGALEPGDYALSVTLLDSQTGKALGQASLGEIQVSDRRRLFDTPPLQHTADVRLGESIKLLGYNLSQEPLTGGARLTTKLYWQATGIIPTAYTVFVQVLGPNGTVIGQHDGLPSDGTLPTTIWEAGEVVPDRHQIDMAITQNGAYRVIAGMYDPTTGTRLPITDAAGEAVGDFWQIDTFTVTEAGS